MLVWHHRELLKGKPDPVKPRGGVWHPDMGSVCSPGQGRACPGLIQGEVTTSHHQHPQLQGWRCPCLSLGARAPCARLELGKGPLAVPSLGLPLQELPELPSAWRSQNSSVPGGKGAQCQHQNSLLGHQAEPVPGVNCLCVRGCDTHEPDQGLWQRNFVLLGDIWDNSCPEPEVWGALGLSLSVGLGFSRFLAVS